MKILNVEIENYMSIPKASVDLSNRGLVLIQGENSDSDSLGSNGSGKTNLLTSISWCLFGKTPKGKGDDVVNKQAKKNCRVVVTIEDNEEIYSIQRHRKHKDHKNNILVFKGETEITCKNDKDTDKLIENILGMDYDIFLNTIFYTSSSFKFSSATDSEMKKSMEVMLNLDIWSKCHEQTKLKISEVETSKALAKVKLDALNSVNIKATEEIVRLKQQQEVDEQKNKQLIKNIESNLSAFDKQIDNLEKELKEFKDTSESTDALEIELETLKQSKQEFDDYEAAKRELEDVISEQNRKLRQKTRDKKDLQLKIQALIEKSEKKEELVGTTCPVCNSIVTQDAVDGTLEEILRESTAYGDKIEKLTADITKLQSDIAEKEECVSEITEALSGRKRLIEDINACSAKIMEIEATQKASKKHIKSLKDNLQSIQKQRRQQELQINTLSESTFDYSEEIKKLEETLKENEQSIIDHNKNLEEFDSQLESLQFWLTAYSNQGIKSLILDDITPFINTRMHKYLSVLSGGTIEAEFSTQDKLKSGEYREKFTLNIKNSVGGDKYASNSDGERRRVDIAVNLALQDLLATRSTKPINIAVYDECFDSLDDVGKERIIEVLTSLDRDTVLVTTHDSRLKTFFDHTITAKKQDGVTTII